MPERKTRHDAIAAVLALLVGTAAMSHEEAPAASSPASTTDPRATDTQWQAGRLALLARAERELAAGKATEALELFDQAAMMLHAPDTEMGLVRSYMQMGQYRRALAFCAHTAGSHLEAPASGVLYAWLLRVGGQGAVAGQVLEQTAARAPGDPVVRAAQAALAAEAPVPAGVLLQTPQRVAPQPAMLGGQPALPSNARVLGSGVLSDGGRRALVPGHWDRAQPLWVRNGLGQTTRASVAPQEPEAAGLTVLLLEAPLEFAEAPAVPRAPFAGSPVFAIEYAVPPSGAEVAWPQLFRGFLGSFQGAAGLRRLGVDVPRSQPHGGPVFDLQGRLLGLSLQQGTKPGDEALLLPVSMWPAGPGASAAASARPPVPLDELYETALKLTLQVIGVP